MRLVKNNIPKNFKKEFKKGEIKNNYNIMFFVSIAFLLCEVLLYILKDRLFGAESAILSFIIVSVIFLPIIYIVRDKIDVVPMIVSKIILFLYCYVVLFFVISVVLLTQSEIDVSYLYVAVVLAISFFISLDAVERILLPLPAYVILIVLLYHFSQNPEIVFVFVANMFIINIIAYGLGSVIRNFNKEAFLHRKMLLEKNLLLEELVEKDAMTGLYNHYTSLQKLSKEIEHTNKTGYPLSVVLIDIDDFKKINDLYGHLVGDEVLKKFSEVMLNNSRSIDKVGRCGGDEFIIILPNTDIEGAKLLSEKIKMELSKTVIESNLSITVSGGISQYNNESVDELIKVTDDKLYKAKKSGKNQFIHDTLK